MDSDFNWTTNFDSKLIKHLINNEIGEAHLLYNKLITPIATAKNKYDILGYYEENQKTRFVIIHFMGYKSQYDENPPFEMFNSLNKAITMIINMYNCLYLGSRYNIMLDSEITKKQKSHVTLAGLYLKMPKIYDCLFKINEYRGKLAATDNKNLLKIQDMFQFFSSDFVYKIRSIFILTEIGNYADAAIILRSLTETFFYFKYYIIKEDGNGLYNYVNQTKKRGIKIKDIMDSIAPNYYATIYDELCKITHGNPLITGLFRGNVSKKDKLKYNMYNINIEWFSYIINLTLPLIYGFFTMFKRVYLNNTIYTSERLSDDIKEVEMFIYKDLEDRYNTYENQRSTIDLYKKIINFD